MSKTIEYQYLSVNKADIIQIKRSMINQSATTIIPTEPRGLCWGCFWPLSYFPWGWLTPLNPVIKYFLTIKKVKRGGAEIILI